MVDSSRVGSLVQGGKPRSTHRKPHLFNVPVRQPAHFEVGDKGRRLAYRHGLGAVEPDPPWREGRLVAEQRVGVVAEHGPE